MNGRESLLRLRPGAYADSLDHAAYLLNAALEADRNRRWWQPPNRLWVSRVEQAAGIVDRVLAGRVSRDACKCAACEAEFMPRLKALLLGETDPPLTSAGAADRVDNQKA